MHGDENTGEAETGIIEGSEENRVRFSPDSVGERIKATLEPLHAQFSALTEMMDRLIQSNLTTEPTTASSRGSGLQYESPYSEGPGSSKFPTVAPLTTAGCSPDSMEKHARFLLDYDNVFYWTEISVDILMKNKTLKCEGQNFWQQYD